MRNPVTVCVRFQIQPTVSHFREPVTRNLMASKKLALDLVGRFKNSESTSSDQIASASSDVLSAVTPIRTLRLGPWWWQRGDVAAIWRGGHDAYVLEGRFYTVSAWFGGVAGKLRGRQVLLWGHGWKRPESGLKRQLRLLLYRLVDGLLVYGDKALELGTSYGVPADKIAVVYNSLYTKDQLPDTPLRRQNTSHQSHRPTIIYSSRLTTRHRLDILAQALQDWPVDTPRPEVIIVGDGVEKTRLEQVFADAGVPADFLGAVYDFHTLQDLYRRADCAVIIGGAGLNVIQALSFGVPVVAEAGNPDSSPEIEAVLEGQTGKFYTTGDVAGLREVLISTLGQPEQLAQMGQQGLELIRQRYTAEAHASAIEAALLKFTGAGE